MRKVKIRLDYTCLVGMIILMNWIVNETKKANKGLQKAPLHIQACYNYWRKIIINNGLETAMKELKGARFEKLKGNRAGQSSCRLSKGYRVIFKVYKNELTVLVLEVNKHEY